ncbi:MAG: bifunctional ornithine acetyltransferase/N-acetylglutamate synthase, partial [Bdellovibrionales bacterium]|nr:bifunctional ornithine acetyltransferase/N-acetylglutamate synthase [Bdellovibrionales bacterium]
STNDCVFMMANGASGLSLRSSQDEETFLAALKKVATTLAQAIASDGEGASKLVEVQLNGSHDLSLARKAARGLIVSPLVKTAIHGEDPNWGRILARLGAEGIPKPLLDQMDLNIQGMRIFSRGNPVAFDRTEVKAAMKSAKIHIVIDLHGGIHSARAWGCDLSKRYIEINTEYT